MENKMETPSSNIETLSKFYKAAPGYLAFFAGSPYFLMYGAGKSLAHLTPFADSKNPRTRMKLAGISYCLILTFIPALPAGTALTCGIALTGALVTALSAPVAYPIAKLMDQLPNPEKVVNKR